LSPEQNWVDRIRFGLDIAAPTLNAYQAGALAQSGAHGLSANLDRVASAVVTNMIESGFGAERAADTDAPAQANRRFWQAGDGTKVLLRPISPRDFELELDFVRGLSRMTRYLRLMSGRQPSADEVRRWTDIDRRREGALIATVPVDGLERQIGVARYVAQPGEHEAEIAIVLGDAWQGHGLGVPLLAALIELARQSGMTRLFGETLSENAAMIALGRRLGFRLFRQRGAAFLTELSLDL
jgi:acetyltransferase